MSFEIFVDSGANVPQRLCAERNIRVISFRFLLNGEEKLCYEENIPFEQTAKEFYDAMRQGADVKTSLICENDFCEAISPALRAGKDVILFTLSSGISGTYQQAKMAQDTLSKQFPKQKIYVIDSANASMGEGLLALKVADLRDMGESAETCAKWASENAYKMNSYLTVGDLKYLRKTGRISTTLAIAGTLLNMKPILRADGGTNAKIVFTGKERGRKKALRTLAEAFAERNSSLDQHVAIMHADCEEDALELKRMLEELGVREITVGMYDLCTGTHVGPGTVALFFMGKDRRLSLPHANLRIDEAIRTPAKQ